MWRTSRWSCHSAALISTKVIGTASSSLSGLFEQSAWTFAPQVVMPLFDAVRQADVIITVTGDLNVVDRQHFDVMKDGALIDFAKLPLKPVFYKPIPKAAP